MNRFTHFELVSNDLEKTAAFYRAVFGWSIEKWEGPIDYWLVTSGGDDSPGINGGLMQMPDGSAGTINTVEVEDLDETLERALAHGAAVILPKDAIPGVGWQAYIKDNCGIIIGLHQADPRAGTGSAP